MKRFMVFTALCFMCSVAMLAQGTLNYGRVAFVSNRSGNENLWVLDISTMEQRQITDFPGNWGISLVMQPQWSEDGTRLLFAGYTHTWHLYMLTFNAGQEAGIELLAAGGRIEYFRWDPLDPDRVYYNLNNQQFHRLRISTREDEALANPAGTCGPETFDIGNNGDLILATRNSVYGYQTMAEPFTWQVIKPYEGRKSYLNRINRRDGWVCCWESKTDPCMTADTDVFKISPDGQTRIQLTFGVPGSEHNWMPSWAGGGHDDFLFLTSTHFGNPEICIMKTDGLSYPDGLINLTNHPAYDREPDWTPLGWDDTAVVVELKNSMGCGLSGGIVRYYDGGWKEFGTTGASGRVMKALKAKNYTFRIIYEGAVQDKAQNTAADPIVPFQTVRVTISLKNSAGQPLDPGTARFYASGWRDFGATSGGEVSRELLPVPHTFRMNYEGMNNDKAQNIGVNPSVEFQTGAVTVRLADSAGAPLDGGLVRFYAGSWRDFGPAAGGVVSKELLPGAYTFRMNLLGGVKDLARNTGMDPLVNFQTGKVFSQTASCTFFYAGGWRNFINGMELLPVGYTFRFNDGTPDTAYEVIQAQVNTVH